MIEKTVSIFRALNMTRQTMTRSFSGGVFNRSISPSLEKKFTLPTVFPQKIPVTPRQQFNRVFSLTAQPAKNLLSEKMFFDLEYQIHVLLHVAQSSKFSLEANSILRKGSDLISSIGCRTFLVLRDEEIKAHIDAFCKWRDGGWWEGEFNHKIKQLQFKLKNAIVINSEGNQLYLVNQGSLRQSPFSIKLTNEDMRFLQKQQRDENGCVVETPENQTTFESIERKVKEAIGDPIDLPLDEKIKRLVIYVLGTMIRAMCCEDDKYGAQTQFQSKLLYPDGKNKNLLKHSIQDLGYAALKGQLPFHVDMVKPEVFGFQRNKAINDQMVKLQTLLDHFKAGINYKPETPHSAPSPLCR